MKTKGLQGVIRTVRRGSAALALLLVLAISFLGRGRTSPAPAARQPADSQAARAGFLSAYGSLPLSFERNSGQTDARVDFLARGNRYVVFLAGREAVLRLSPAQEAHGNPRGGAAAENAPDAVLRITLAGSNPHAEAEGLEIQPGQSNYFIGSDPSRWRRNVPLYARVRYRGIYPGVDLVYYGHQGQLESDYIVAPGADPQRIRLRIAGAEKWNLDSQGNLSLATPAGAVMLCRPRAYQEFDGTRREIAASFVQRGPRSAGFRVGAYDSTRPVVIDPVVLVYSTYLGGTGIDIAFGIAVDSTGNAYVAGRTTSANFPIQGAFQASLKSTSANAFVTKLNPTGTALVYSTYLGGSGTNGDAANGVAVDSAGNAYVTGPTASPDFPLMNAYQLTDRNSSQTVFLTKLNAAGSNLLYSTYLGGTVSEAGEWVAVDSTGNAYIVGETSSHDFPVTGSAFQFTNTAPTGPTAFVSRIDTTQSGFGSLVYSTYLGGSTKDIGIGIAVDSKSTVYVAGQTFSTDFPVMNAFQSVLKSTAGGNVFVSRLDTTKSGAASLLYSTYLGGTGAGGDLAFNIALDPAFNAYVVGTTKSTDFPTTAGAFQTTGNIKGKAFVSKLDATKSGASSLVYSTYLGGTGGERGNGIAVNALGDAYVSGQTSSADFPTTSGAFQKTLKAAPNAFVSTLNSTGTAPLLFSTYLGGTTSDISEALALDSAPAPNAYVTGQTSSTDFPLTVGVFQSSLKGASNAFVSKLSPGVQVSGVFLTPSSVNFGTQSKGITSPAQIVTLHNATAVTLSSIVITILGANAADFAKTTACGATLAAGATCTISVTFTPSTTLAEVATLNVADSDSSSPQQSALSGTGTAIQPDFTIAVAPPSASVTSGSSAAFTVTVTSTTSFASAVRLSCTGLPLHSTCPFSPSSVTPPANGTVTSAGTITTFPSAIIPPRPSLRLRPPNAMWPWMALGLALILAAGCLAARRVPRKLAWAFAIFALLALANCASNPGTPPGTYTIKITGTSGSLTHSANFTLTVN